MNSEMPEEVRVLIENANRGEPALTALQGRSFVKKLGQGGMGAVYLLQNESGEAQALKIIIPRGVVDRRAEELFLREVENTRALRHPNVVDFIAAGSWQGILFYTMEYCPEGCAADLIPPGGTLPLAEAVEITLQTLSGLEYIHQAEVSVRHADGTMGLAKGLVHRDFKPWNILLSKVDGQRVAKVADFGLSKAFEAAGLTRITRTGEANGTPQFMPRQQCVRFKYARPEVDVWAAAASLYFFLTGAFPRDCPFGRTWADVIRKERPVPIRNRNAAVPAPLATLIDAALDDSQTLKFPTAAGLAAAIRQAVGS